MAKPSGKEILFGFHSVTEALKAGKRQIETVLISDRRSAGRADKIVTLAEERGVPVEFCDSNRLDKLTKTPVHQGLAARVSEFPVRNGLDIIPEVQERTSPCFILILENIEDPHNLGALIRTALCAGVEYILIPRNRSAGPSPTVSRTSAGAMEHAGIYMVTNTASVLRGLKESGVWIFGLEAEGCERAVVRSAACHARREEIAMGQ